MAPLEHADALDDIAREVGRFAGVHVCRLPRARRAAGPTARCPATASPTSRAILGALDEAGWDGLYDIEIFSDDGTFGSAYADSLWDVAGRRAARRAHARRSTRAWERNAQSTSVPRPSRPRRQTVKESR